MQKKRQINYEILSLLVKSVTQRDIARHLGINRKTVARRLEFFGKLAIEISHVENLKLPMAQKIEFDELETSEHTKMKMVSVILAVESRTRRILSLRAARMPTKGLLAKRAVKKYGKRQDERPQKRKECFEELQSLVGDGAYIKSDMNPFYESLVQKHFPKSLHIEYKGRTARNNGHGELKRGFDPLFSLNHTCAMNRSQLSRLVRKTWATTKRIERLSDHMNLYKMTHNLFWLPKLKLNEIKELMQNYQLI